RGQRKTQSTSGVSARRHRFVRPVEVAAAAHADLAVQGHDGAALRPFAARLVLLKGVEDRGQRADQREDEPDREPDPERAALQLADHGGREAAEKGQDDVGQLLERSVPTAQKAAISASTMTTIQATAATKP